MIHTLDLDFIRPKREMWFHWQVQVQGKHVKTSHKSKYTVYTREATNSLTQKTHYGLMVQYCE